AAIHVLGPAVPAHVCVEVAGAHHGVPRVARTEIEAAVEADAAELHFLGVPAVVAGIGEATGGHFDTQQGDRASLPAVAGVDAERVLVEVLVDPTLAGLGTDEEASTITLAVALVLGAAVFHR